MQTNDVLLLQGDPRVAEMLARSLSGASLRVRQAKSLDDLHLVAAKLQPSAIVLDLESATLEQLKSLKREFQNIRIVCNHRVADEEMWSATMDAGADDFCPSSDTRSILKAVASEESARAIAA
jgi:DNA-binding NarL/FixJ family response regulator